MALKFTVYLDGADTNKPTLKITYVSTASASIEEQVMEALSDLAATGSVGYAQTKTTDVNGVTTLILKQGT